ncbi:hypothetical protein JXA80_04050, partial [bacterium]|nr:hypothetical protein [candidate division CSSED10-310 bacterium]
VGIGVGIQSYSETVRRNIFNRPISDRHMDAAIRVLDTFDHAVRAICYDFIVDFPGDTDEFKKENIRRLNRLKRNFTINIFPYTSYPGTPMDRNLEDGHPARNGVYRLNNPYQPSYLNRLLRMTPYTRPAWVDFFLTDSNRWVRALFFLYYAYFTRIRQPARIVLLLVKWHINALLDRFAIKGTRSDRFDSFKFEH